MALDAGIISSYTLTIKAHDRSGGSGSLSSTAQVLVTVTTVNQHDPIFGQSSYTASVAEGAAVVGYQLVQVRTIQLSICCDMCTMSHRQFLLVIGHSSINLIRLLLCVSYLDEGVSFRRV